LDYTREGFQKASLLGEARAISQKLIARRWVMLAQKVID